MAIISKLISVALLLLTTPVLGRRHLDYPHGHKEFTRETTTETDQSMVAAIGTTETPIVQGTPCTDMCLFNDGKNKWCFRFEAPTLEIGWEWK